MVQRLLCPRWCDSCWNPLHELVSIISPRSNDETRRQERAGSSGCSDVESDLDKLRFKQQPDTPPLLPSPRKLEHIRPRCTELQILLLRSLPFRQRNWWVVTLSVSSYSLLISVIYGTETQPTAATKAITSSIYLRKGQVASHMNTSTENPSLTLGKTNHSRTLTSPLIFTTRHNFRRVCDNQGFVPLIWGTRTTPKQSSRPLHGTLRPEQHATQSATFALDQPSPSWTCL